MAPHTGRRVRWPSATGMSQTSISLIWRAFGLQPHRAESFKLSTDPLFIEKVRDVVGPVPRPARAGGRALRGREEPDPGAQPVRSRSCPMMPGTPERRSHDYVRHGTTSLFAALDMATGKVIGSLHRRHRAGEFKKFLVHIDEEVPKSLEVHLSWITTPPTRLPRSSAGCCATPASICTSRRRRARGSTWSSGGSPS